MSLVHRSQVMKKKEKKREKKENNEAIEREKQANFERL